MKILVTGAKGQVGLALRLRAEKLNITVVSFDADNLDLSDIAQVTQAMQDNQPDYVINCASYSVVDLAETHPNEAYRVNRDGAKILAQACHSFDVPLLHLSTNYVFQGNGQKPIKEDHIKHPVNIFGDSKAAGEDFIVQYCSKHIILRVSWIFSACGNNFVLRTWRKMRSDAKVIAVDDEYGCPTDAVDVARVLLAMVQQIDCGIEVWGTYHYSGAEVVTWKGFAEAILAAVKYLPNIKADEIIAVTSKDWQAEAARPNYSVLDCRKILNTFGIRQRPWRVGLVKVIDSLSNFEKLSKDKPI